MNYNERTLAAYKKRRHVTGEEVLEARQIWLDIYLGFAWFAGGAAWNNNDRARLDAPNSAKIFLKSIDEILEIARLELTEIGENRIQMPNLSEMPEVRMSDFSEIGPIVLIHRCPATILLARLATAIKNPDPARAADMKQLVQALGKDREKQVLRYGQMSLPTTPEHAVQAAKNILAEEKAAERAAAPVQSWRGPSMFMRQVWERTERSAKIIGRELKTKYEILERNLTAACVITANAVKAEWQKDQHTQTIEFNEVTAAFTMEDSVKNAIYKSLDEVMTEFSVGLAHTNIHGGGNSPMGTYLQGLELQPYCLDLNPQNADGRYHDDTINGKFYQKEWQILRKFCVDIGREQHGAEMDQDGRSTYVRASMDVFQEQLNISLYAPVLLDNSLTLNANQGDILPRLNPRLMATTMAKLQTPGLGAEEKRQLQRMADFVFDYQTLLEEIHIEMLQKLYDNRLAMPLSGENRAGIQFKEYPAVPEGHPKLYELQQIINSRKALLAVRKTYSLYGKHARQEECKKAIPLAIGLALGALALDAGLTAAASYTAGAIVSEEVSREAIKAMQDLLHGSLEGFINACNAGNPIALAVTIGATLGLVSLVAGAFIGAELSGQFGDTPEATRFFGQRIKQELPAIQIVS